MKSETETGIENLRWFVLNYVGVTFHDNVQKVIDKFNVCHDCNLELFAPTYVVMSGDNGKMKMRTISLTFHYMFVRGAFSSVKELCGQNNGFSFMIDHGGSERYATVDDKEMANFMNIARAYKNCLPYFSLDEIDLEDGDLVEVVNGNFPGLVGVYMPKPKSSSGNIILRVYNNVGTIAFDVKAKDVRVLEFSHKSTRANDQLDALIPHLLKALRCHNEAEALPTALIAKLSVFSSRMGKVQLNNRKLNARLQALLYGCNSILGNVQEATQAKAKYEKINEVVTNEWTSALITLIFSIIENDIDRLKTVKKRIEELKPSSKTQHMILDEYRFYDEQ